MPIKKKLQKMIKKALGVEAEVRVVTTKKGDKAFMCGSSENIYKSIKLLEDHYEECTGIPWEAAKAMEADMSSKMPQGLKEVLNGILGIVPDAAVKGSTVQTKKTEKEDAKNKKPKAAKAAPKSKK